MTALPQDAVPDLQQRIAELERQLETAVNERDAAIERQTASALVNFRIKNELRTATERQKASAEILGAIANTHGDAEHALQRIAETTRHFFNAAGVSIRIAEGDQWVQTVRVGDGPLLSGAQPASHSTARGHNLPATVYRENRQIHIPDLDNIDPAMANWPAAAARAAGIRTISGTPLRRDGKAIGTLLVYRDRLAGFSDDELALQQSFADQAVIAIENARLFNEVQERTRDLSESLQQQTATADVLKVISRSAFNLDAVLNTLVASASTLCDADNGSIFLRDDNFYRLASSYGHTAEVEAFARANPLPVNLETVTRRAGTSGAPIHVRDVLEDETRTEFQREYHKATGFRTLLSIPFKRAGETVGVFNLTRRVVRPFTERHIELVQTFADQAVIAIENVRLFNETQEALERQTATADILKVIASSPSEVQPVFDAILARALHLCEAAFGFLTTSDGERFAFAAQLGVPPALAEHFRGGMDQPLPGDAHWRLLEGEDLVHNPDQKDEEAYRSGNPLRRAVVDIGGARSALVVALRKSGALRGSITIYRKEVRPFSTSQVDLLRHFADQAVIAIENTRLFNETQEALERQTATAEILKVIASSPSNVQPVFDVIVERAVRLCGGRMGRVYRYDSGVIEMVAGHGLSVTGLGKVQQVFPRPATDDTIAGRVMLSHRPYFVTDIQHEDSVPSLSRQMIEALGTRSQVTVPMLRTGQAIGAITVGWAEPGAFGDQQVSLLQTFADQAVIAIENVRLFNETQEALERQTATADILKVIASSPSDTTPVFQAIATSTKRLLGGFSCAVWRFVDGKVHLAAFTPTTPAADDALRADFPQPVENFEAFRLARNGVPFPIPDTEDIAHAPLREIARLHGFRSMMFVPLMNGGVPIGIIAPTRAEPGAFAPHHVQLLQTFADQAVIAIENTRLFNEVQERTVELTESLQQQTATADLLQVISRSAFDLQPIFDAIAERAVTLCGASRAFIYRFDGELLNMVASHNAPEDFKAWVAQHPIVPGRHSGSGRAALERRTIHIHDVRADPEYTFGAKDAEAIRTILGVPILKGDELLGVMMIYHLDEVRPFTEKQIALVETFADQAAIAVENVRLFNEVEQRTEDLAESLQQQTATSEVLQIISSSPGDLTPVFDKMLENATRVCGAGFGAMNLVEGDTMRRAALYNPPPEFAAALTDGVLQIHPQSSIAAAVNTRRVVQVEDMRRSPSYLARAQHAVELAELGGARTIVVVPMLRDDQAIGVITVYRQEVRPFSEKQIELLTNFARQAVIAIENARLLRELRQRTDDLTEALQFQTGSANILNVIASSPTNVEPVLKAIFESAAKLCEAYDAALVLKDGDDLRFSAHYGPIPIGLEKWPINRRWTAGRAFIDQTPVHIEDLRDEVHAEFSDGRELALRMGHRSILSVPLLREKESIGAIVLRRTEVHPFSDKQIALLQTFADQAVIAIGNVRLFEEVQARTRDLQESLQFQTASADVLKVISRSPDTLQPVLDVIVQTSRELCNALTAVIFLLRDGMFHLAAVSVDQNFQRPGYIEDLRNNPVSPDQVGSILARATRDERTVNIPNTEEDPEAGLGGPLDAGGPKALLCVPLMRDHRIIGAVTLRQSHLAPFTQRQIEAVETFADQAVIAISNVTLFEQVQQRTRELSKSLDDLRTAQDRLVQTEKLASLGQLTAGIAHEIKNPLNFVNNFAALSAELTDELNDVLRPAVLDETIRAEVDELTGTLKDNLGKVVQHGKRADSIVKNMLLHSREGSGEHRPSDINALVDESLNLAYHGARAEKPQFNVTLQRNLDPEAGMVDVFPQEITRVFLNLLSNGFYAVTKRKADNGSAGFEPTVSAMTKGRTDGVEIRIRDNGTGIPLDVKEKMFNPFFTTKPAGEGTGLGLSMSYDIIVKQHGGTIDVETLPGEFTEFTIVLPRTSLSKKN